MSWINLILLAFGIPGLVAGAIIGLDPWLGLSPGTILIAALVGLIIGGMVGEAKGRGWLGAFLGITLGPAGWILCYLLPRKPAARC
jgi:hypothetical protein